MSNEVAMDQSPEVVRYHFMSAEIGKLALALCKAQAAMKPAVRDSMNPFFNKSYADLASVWEAIRKPLSDNELSVIQTNGGTAEAVKVFTMLLHSSGQWIRSELTMKPVKPDPQGVGSCITYARRYDLAAMVGVAPEDDDGNAASRKNGLSKPEVTAETAQVEFKRGEPAWESEYPKGSGTVYLWVLLGDLFKESWALSRGFKKSSNPEKCSRFYDHAIAAECRAMIDGKGPAFGDES